MKKDKIMIAIMALGSTVFYKDCGDEWEEPLLMQQNGQAQPLLNKDTTDATRMMAPEKRHILTKYPANAAVSRVWHAVAGQNIAIKKGIMKPTSEQVRQHGGNGPSPKE